MKILINYFIEFFDFYYLINFIEFFDFYYIINFKYKFFFLEADGISLKNMLSQKL
jgi:hypothetical protein